MHPERLPVAGDERADVPVADDPERASVQLPADVVCHVPARSATASATMQRVEARISASVSSAGAYADPEPVQTTIPRRVHSATSMWGIPRPGLADQPQVGEERQQRLRRSACARGSGRAPRRRRSGPPARQPSPVASDCTTTSWPCEKRERVEPLDGPLVVLHHDDAHPASLSRRRSSRARARPQRPRSRMAATIPPDPLSAGRVFLHAALRLRRHRRKEAPWPSPRKSSRS